jgi:hypothetical protein
MKSFPNLRNILPISNAEKRQLPKKEYKLYLFYQLEISPLPRVDKAELIGYNNSNIEVERDSNCQLIFLADLF